MPLNKKRNWEDSVFNVFISIKFAGLASASDRFGIFKRTAIPPRRYAKETETDTTARLVSIQGEGTKHADDPK